MKHYFVIDGGYMLARFSHTKAKPEFFTEDGLFTPIISKFLDFFYDNVRTSHDVEVVVCLEGRRSTFRRNLFEGYKANREKNETAEQKAEKQEKYKRLRTGIEVLTEVLRHSNIPIIRLDGEESECDDVCNVLTKALISRGNKVTIVSEDQDFLLLLPYFKEKFTLFRPYKPMYVNINNFKDVYGYPYEYELLKLCLTGSHNNINGIKGIGKVRALKILKELDDISLESLKKWAKNTDDKYSEKILEGWDIIERNKKLIDPYEVPLNPDDVYNIYESCKNELEPSFKKVIGVMEDYKIRSNKFLAFLNKTGLPYA